MTLPIVVAMGTPERVRPRSGLDRDELARLALCTGPPTRRRRDRVDPGARRDVGLGAGEPGRGERAGRADCGRATEAVEAGHVVLRRRKGVDRTPGDHHVTVD